MKWGGRGVVTVGGARDLVHGPTAGDLARRNSAGRGAGGTGPVPISS